MSSYGGDEITRDGFACSYGRFYAIPGKVERVESPALRRMFLPKLAPEGRGAIAASYGDNFVRGQLKHYDVPFNEGEISGNGTLLMKKLLQAGRCDEVPDRITELREQMHAEWLNKRTAEQLSNHPEWVMERYFLSSGRPDRTKTTMVVGIPFDQSSQYRAGQMCEAARKVAGLHQKTAVGPKTKTIFMGWNSEAVSARAKGHANNEAKAVRAVEDKRESERARMHTDYLRTLERKETSRDHKAYSPVGSYIVNCEKINDGWPDEADDLSLDIRQTKEPGVFEASFDFGALEGVMIISSKKNKLEQYCSQLDRGAEFNSDDSEEGDWDEGDCDDEEDKDDETSTKFSKKRKAEAPRGRGRPPKKPKAGAAQPRIYLLKLKCRETGEGVIEYTAEEGTITFKDHSLTSFTGKANLPFISEGVAFSARKIADAPSSPGNSWADYSEEAYDYARVNRWR
jgi:hypothetical protein